MLVNKIEIAKIFEFFKCEAITFFVMGAKVIRIEQNLFHLFCNNLSLSQCHLHLVSFPPFISWNVAV